MSFNNSISQFANVELTVKCMEGVVIRKPHAVPNLLNPQRFFVCGAKVEAPAPLHKEVIPAWRTEIARKAISFLVPPNC